MGNWVTSLVKSEVSNAYIYGIQKNGTDKPVCRAGIETAEVKNGVVDIAGEGEGGMN